MRENTFVQCGEKQKEKTVRAAQKSISNKKIRPDAWAYIEKIDTPGGVLKEREKPAQRQGAENPCGIRGWQKKGSAEKRKKFQKNAKKLRKKGCNF